MIWRRKNTRTKTKLEIIGIFFVIIAILFIYFYLTYGTLGVVSLFLIFVAIITIILLAKSEIQRKPRKPIDWDKLREKELEAQAEERGRIKAQESYKQYKRDKEEYKKRQSESLEDIIRRTR